MKKGDVSEVSIQCIPSIPFEGPFEVWMPLAQACVAKLSASAEGGKLCKRSTYAFQDGYYSRWY